MPKRSRFGDVEDRNPEDISESDIDSYLRSQGYSIEGETRLPKWILPAAVVLLVISQR